MLHFIKTRTTMQWIMAAAWAAAMILLGFHDWTIPVVNTPLFFGAAYLGYKG